MSGKLGQLMGASVLAAATVLGAAAASAQGGVLQVAAPEEILNLDPQGAYTLVPSTVTAMQHIYDPLLTYKGEEPVPMLATSWSQTDPRTWEFKLREGVKFHNGEDFTADDVVASLDRLRKQGNSLAKNYRTVESVEAVDPHTVRIVTKEPFGALLQALSITLIAPASELAQLDESGANEGGINFSGTGPFKLNRLIPGQRILMSANEDYWGGAPKVEGLTFVMIPETAARMTALLNGEVDFSWDFPEDLVGELKSVGNIKVDTVPSNYYYFFWMNEDREPFGDLRVRRAMWEAVNWQKIVDDLCPNTCTLAEGPIPPNVFGWAAQEPYEFNPDLAKSHLAKAGLADGFSSTITIINNARDPQIVQAAIPYWREVGINIEPQVMEKAVWLDRNNSLDYDILMQAHHAQTGDAQNTLGRLYYGPNKEMGYSNDYLDKVIEEVTQTTDAAERKAGYDRIAAIIWEEAVGIFPIDLQLVYAQSDGLEGVELSGGGRPRFHDAALAD